MGWRGGPFDYGNSGIYRAAQLKQGIDAGGERGSIVRPAGSDSTLQDQ